MVCAKPSGFTQVELLVTIVLIGIVSAIALPRFTGETGTEGRGFSDEVAIALRFAQKTAIASRRTVCASLTATTLQLTIASSAGTTSCNTNLAGPGGLSPHRVDAGDNKFRNTVRFNTGFPTALYFDAQGRPVTSSGVALTSATTISISSGNTVTVEAESGHVHF